MDMAQAAFELDSTYGIMTRVGLHCAPNAHKTLGTYPEGTLRFSFGPENTKQELDIALDAFICITIALPANDAFIAILLNALFKRIAIKGEFHNGI